MKIILISSIISAILFIFILKMQKKTKLSFILTLSCIALALVFDIISNNIPKNFFYDISYSVCVLYLAIISFIFELGKYIYKSINLSDK